MLGFLFESNKFLFNFAAETILIYVDMHRLSKAILATLTLILLPGLSFAQETQDVSSWLNADENDMSGWTTNNFWLNTGAGGSHYNSEDGSYLMQPFIEYWNGNGRLSLDKLTQTLTHVPYGRYSIKASIVATDQRKKREVKGVSLFLGNNSVALNTGDGVPQWYEVMNIVSAGTVDLGIKIEQYNGDLPVSNWVAIDNISLLFHGTKQELITAEKKKISEEGLQIYTQEEIDKLINDAIAGITDLRAQFNALEELRKDIADKVVLKELMPKETPLDVAVPNLRINGLGMAYDFSNGIYLFSAPESAFADNFTATVTYDKNDGWGDLVIGGRIVESGSEYTFAKAQAEKKYTFSVSNTNGKRITSYMTMTQLPIVEIYGDFGNEYKDGYIRVYEPGSKQPALISSKKKWRGGITNNADKHKRNYAVKLYGADGKKLDQKFFGLRKDNKWILEAAQVDMSRVRNRVLTDLWNDFAAKPYYFESEPKALSGTRGATVELLLNGNYNGIYHMTERIDRKQMKLVDYDEVNGVQHGQLWKGKDWSYEMFMGHYYDQNYYPRDPAAPFDPNSDTWQAYNYEYPDFDDVKPADWQTLYDAVNFICSASDSEIKAHFCEYFDFPVFLDYYIFMETLLSTDNHGKNAYYAVYDKQKDKKITVALWDVDAVMGQRWSDYYFHSDLMRPEQDYAQYITRNEHGDWNLFRKLRDLNINNFNEAVRYRYRELRNGPLSPEAINERFATALNRLMACGAEAREKRRWDYDSDLEYHALDFQDELEFIQDWVTRRMNYLDVTRFKIASLPDAINDASVAQSASDDVWVSGGSLHVYAVSDHAITVRTLSGVAVKTYELTAGTNDLGQLPQGVYVVGNKKIVVK